MASVILEYLLQLLIGITICSLVTTKNCPETAIDCHCEVLNGKMEVTCIFQSNMSATTIINSTGSENITFMIDILNLNSNNLTSIDESTFANIAYVGVLNLSDNNLMEIPEALQVVDNITVLDVSRNRIQNLNFTSLRSLSVQSLNIAFNEIENIIGEDDFKTMKILNISHNNLKVVFDHLWLAADILDLSYNTIRSLNPLPKSSVGYIYLNNNELTAIESYTFEHAREINELYLISNRISDLSPAAFSGLELITELYLDNNELERLQSGLFTHLPFLVTLSLSDNNLDALEPEMFTGLENTLQQLMLRNNKISYLTSNNTFQNLKNLRLLDLSFNPNLTDINELVFPSHLASLEVQNCSLTDISNCKLFKLMDMQYLDITGNNLECSCHLSRLYSWYKGRTIRGYVSRKGKRSSWWTCRNPETGVISYVKENIAYCGRYQNIEYHCDDFEVVKDTSPIQINISMTTSDNLILTSWQVRGDVDVILGYRVSYESEGSILFNSPILDKSQNSFAISFVTEQDTYSVCVDVLSNTTFILASDCAYVKTYSLDYLIGILSGIMLLIPCMVALICILRKDRLVKRAQYSRLEEHPTKSLPNKDAVVVAVFGESTLYPVTVDTAVFAYHENKAFSGDGKKSGTRYEVTHDSTHL